MSDKKPDDDLIGQTIAGRYRIISRLGAGGMGVAYRAWDEEGGVPVVIKIPKKAFLDDPKFAERFAREIRLLQGLRHPHIVPIVDVGEHEGLPYVAMRFLPGGSLSDRRLRDEDGKPRPNPPGMLHLWLPAVAEALDHVHANGVVHRDVKPANIFFDAFWGAFLGDFGIAKIVEESESFDPEHTLTATSMGIGTPDYMGPEQFTPKPILDGRTDQYALAVIVYEMLAGRRPFTGATAHIVVEVTTLAVPRLDRLRRGLPASLVEAVHRGLTKNPRERFGTCRAFASEVLRDVPLLADEPDVARLLCPKCSKILRLPTAAAGQQGRCPKCQTTMKVADDLGAFWLLDEARRQQREATRTSDEARLVAEEEFKAFEPVSGTTPVSGTPRPLLRSIVNWLDSHGLAVAGGMAILVTVPWLLLLFPGLGPKTQAERDRQDAEIRRLEGQFADQSQRLRAAAEAKNAAEKQLQTALAETDAARELCAELTAQLDTGSEAKDAAEKQLQAARAETDAARRKIQELETRLAARPPAREPSATAPPLADQAAEEILARPPIENSVGMKFKLIPPGTFMMGSEDGRDDEKPVHEKRIPKPFYLGVYEVTNAQWRKVMGDEPPSYWKDDDRPVEKVSWRDAVAFCQALSNLNAERAAGRVYRLPTEAEWEYACRAGTTMRWSAGNDEKSLEDFAWFHANSNRRTRPVGQKRPNLWGLHDMHGNVWEWCADLYGPYPVETITDPVRAAEVRPSRVVPNSYRVSRGGHWNANAFTCRSASRQGGHPHAHTLYDQGFRVALSLSGADQANGEEQARNASGADTATVSIPSQGPEEQAEPAVTAQEILARPPLRNSIGMKLKLIPPGTCMMGSNDRDAYEKPVHQVRITKPFYLGVYELTNAQWKAVMGREPPSHWKDDDRPVENVNWNDAVSFCQKLSGMPAEQRAGRVYRLPTEAEWEYACRAGTTTKWVSGDDDSLLGDFAWFGSNSNGQTHPAGQKKPNAWGLHDMHGNVWELCGDWFGPYMDGAATDPQGPDRGSFRVFRGGSWSSPTRRCRSASRGRSDPFHRDDSLGFRLALSPSDSTPPEADE